MNNIVKTCGCLAAARSSTSTATCEESAGASVPVGDPSRRLIKKKKTKSKGHDDGEDPEDHDDDDDDPGPDAIVPYRRRKANRCLAFITKVDVRARTIQCNPLRCGNYSINRLDDRRYKSMTITVPPGVIFLSTALEGKFYNLSVIFFNDGNLRPNGLPSAQLAKADYIADMEMIIHMMGFRPRQ